MQVTVAPCVARYIAHRRRRGLRLRGGYAELGGGNLRVRPASPRDDRQLAQQSDGARVVVSGGDLDRAVLEHLDQDLAAEVGADDGQRPVVERSDPAGGDVGVLGREVGTRLATLTGP